MPFVTADGISTHYEVRGDGPPLLMFSPGGFDARLENWSSFSLYARLGLLESLEQRYTCILFDRRESGRSAGRVQRLGWPDYVAQAVGLLDALDVESAHLMGGCVGCSSAVALAVARPARVRSLVLYSPAGGPRYRMKQYERFAAHAAFVAEHGLAAVVERARTHDDGFSTDPAVGPWVAWLRADVDAAAAYAQLDRTAYLTALTGSARLLFDRDTVPGFEPEDLLASAVPALIVPGQDTSHAPSAARYLQECLPHAQYWDVPVAEQTSETAPARVRAFLDALPA
ncbi:alpha/beta fold hydrolase [uncultured Jatrophihabitans sp.]|uniref:alpha/beta fold hydrolase n=1 Tax=uncultured Jatrophihabitans sp. TaxID=1610747 RepID=UPI0035CA4E46